MSCGHLHHNTYDSLVDMEILSINTRLLTCSPLAVKIVKVESPTLFWVQLVNCSEDFEDLLDDLSRRMTRRGPRLRFPPDRVLPDELVAIREGRGWQRGIVLELVDNRTARIALRDWGRIIRRPISEIYQLEDKFRELEWQGIACGLAYTTSCMPGKEWTRKTREITKLLAERCDGWISIRGTVGDEAALVKLDVKIESGSDHINLKEALVRLGSARHSEKIKAGPQPSI